MYIYCVCKQDPLLKQPTIGGLPNDLPFPHFLADFPVGLGPSGGPVEVPMGKVNCFEPMARSGDADDGLAGTYETYD